MVQILVMEIGIFAEGYQTHQSAKNIDFSTDNAVRD